MTFTLFPFAASQSKKEFTCRPIQFVVITYNNLAVLVKCRSPRFLNRTRLNADVFSFTVCFIKEPIIVPNGSLYFYTNITERLKNCAYYVLSYLLKIELRFQLFTARILKNWFSETRAVACRD